MARQDAPIGAIDRSPLSLRNAFDAEYLTWIDRRDEPGTVAEADAAGPWVVRPHPEGGWAVLRAAERLDDGDQPAGVFGRIETAQLVAALLPGTGKDPVYRLEQNKGARGWALEDLAGPAGHLRLFDERLVTALNVADALLRSPDALARLLEASGRVALEHVGRILVQRLQEAEEERAELHHT
jgi:hypothetical protein